METTNNQNTKPTLNGQLNIQIGKDKQNFTVNNVDDITLKDDDYSDSNRNDDLRFDSIDKDNKGKIFIIYF